MNLELSHIIKMYCTESHYALNKYLVGKSKDTLIGVLMDLLTMYVNDKNSSTLREFLTVTLSGYEHRESKIGYNGYKHNAYESGNTIKCEAKPKNIDTSEFEKYANKERKTHPAKLNGGGNFWEKGVMIHPMDWLRKTKWTIRQEIIWDRMIAANIRGWRFWQVEERIYWLYKPEDNRLIGNEIKPKHALLTSIWRFPPEQNNPHPAPFPLALPVRIIYSLLDDAKGVVIDPYCGSGTTLVAAKLLGHNYIGIEISGEYIEMAKTRLVNCESELHTLKDEMNKHFVTKTFKDRKANGEFTGRFKKGRIELNNKGLSSLFN